MTRCQFISFGCKVNQYDTQAIRERCRELGVSEAGDDQADVVVINTCSVTEDADREALRTIRKIRRRNASARIIVTGCLVDRRLKALDGVDVLVPTRQKHLIADLVTDATRQTSFTPCFDGGFTPLRVSGFAGHTRAFLKLQDGCDYSCSFCKIPQVRGRSVSRPLEAILEEAGRLVAAKYREIVLTGVSLGLYGREASAPGPDLATAVERIAQIDGLTRLRLSSIEPGDVTPRLLEVMTRQPILCRHLHLPLQSGAARILHAMRRHYAPDDYLGLVDDARTRIPGLSLTTDVLVGFPGESEDDFAATEDLLHRARPLRLHAFPYSRRGGTMAAVMPEQVPQAVIRQRMARLRVLGNQLSRHEVEPLLGQTVVVLVERRDAATGRLHGYTDTYVNAWFDGPDELTGRFVPVRIDAAGEGQVEACLT